MRRKERMIVEWMNGRRRWEKVGKWSKKGWRVGIE
jgi:hypothetical protein